MATTSKQRLALAICDFLSASASDGTVPEDEKESIDVATTCIAGAFGVDPSDKAAVTSAIGSQNLERIYEVYEKLKNSAAAPKPAAGASASASSSTSTGDAAEAAGSPSTTSDLAPPTEEQKKQAEGLKSRGNAAMAQKDYTQAVDLYTQALALHPGNAVFLSNRAAAHSAARNHASARADAEAAVASDPNYTKGWSRLGLARFALGDAKGAMEAYKQGIDYEGSGGSDAMKKGYETAKRRVEELEAEGRDEDDLARGASPDLGAGPGLPSLSDLAGMFGGAGRGGGGGGGGGGGSGGSGSGMPDLSAIMSNPMFASMAQNLMSNPDMMNNLMSNPRLREMANQFGGGGGMPNFSELMSDPNIADMARSMMGSGGRGSGAGADPGAGPGAGPGADP